MSLTKFMKKKIEFLERETKDTFDWLLTPEDERDLLNWTNEEIKYVASKLKNELYEFWEDTNLSLSHRDSYICPWCIKNKKYQNTNCKYCMFGRIHEICTEYNSDYDNADTNLYDVLNKSSNNKEYKQELLDALKEEN